LRHPILGTACEAWTWLGNNLSNDSLVPAKRPRYQGWLAGVANGPHRSLRSVRVSPGRTTVRREAHFLSDAGQQETCSDEGADGGDKEERRALQ
jgi:hypothetical protein